VAHSRAAPGARPPHGRHRVGAALWLAFGIAVAAVLALLSVPTSAGCLLPPAGGLI
jgi:hypothetical protein